MLNSPNNPNSPRLQPPAQPTSPVLQLTPRVGPSTSSPAQPVNASINQHGGVAAPSQPEFAEFLTPAKLRPKRRKGRQHLQTAVTPVEAPLQAGPSHHGYTTTEGDLFRGTVSDPTRLPPQPQADDDAITIGGSSSTSSSSSWSWQSDLERGRRATMAVIERLGGAIGVRRGSVSTISTLGTEGRSEAATVTRRGRLSRILTRTATRGSGASSPERPKRQHLPRKREFTLLLPPDTTTNNPNSDRERVIRTPSLPTILERVRTLRQASGWSRDGASTPLEEVPIRRGGSAPGSTRPRARGAQSFVPPPIPARPGVASRAKSRVEALRMTSGDGLVRPKSVSDLMGLKNPYGSFTSLSALGEVTSPITEVRAPNPDPKGKGKGCWWLDVSCPGWEDLRDLGELLGLHPLTLEDVLQQDPREKLDTFDSLGYYFIVARALDESYFKYTPGAPSSSLFSKLGTGSPLSLPTQPLTPDHKKERRRRGWGMGRAAGKLASQFREKVEIVEDNPGKEGLEGLGVGAVNVYLVVFADGIVSFHFEDITKHTKRVLDKALSLATEAEGSDWIAHGLLDSIVDAFFPLIRYVDGEVDEIDSITIDPSVENPTYAYRPHLTTSSPSSSPPIDAAAMEMSEKISLDENGNKVWRIAPEPVTIPSPFQRFRSHLPNLPRIHLRVHLPRPLIYIRLFWLPTSDEVRTRNQDSLETSSDRSKLIRRITETRRLVTGLSRLLGSKQIVVGRLRKRAKEIGGGVDAYIGDLEDHILLLETSLFHYEYILSHCQPAYLSHLNVGFSFVRGKRDRAILALSTVTISILPMQFITSIFSMNVRVPHNGEQDSINYEAPDDGTIGHYYAFAGILVAVFVVAATMVSMVRYWRYLAKRKWGKVRGAEVQAGWGTYWGLQQQVGSW